MSLTQWKPLDKKCSIQIHQWLPLIHFYGLLTTTLGVCSFHWEVRSTSRDQITVPVKWGEETDSARQRYPEAAVHTVLFTRFLLYRLSWPDCHGPITAKRGRASATTSYTSTQGCKKIGVPVHSHLGNGLFWRWCDSHLGIKPFIDLSHMFNSFSMCRACPCGERDHDNVCQLVVGEQVW